MSNKCFVNCVAMVVSSLAVWGVTERASANASAYSRVQLQEQIDRADNVAHVVILQSQSLADVDNGPAQSCGVKYRVRVVEQFKGKLDAQVTSFATHRLLMAQRKLQAGDHVLVLLKKVSGIATASDFEGDPSMEQRAALSTKPATVACQRARGNLYLTDFAENIFLIASAQGSKTWLEFSPGRTLLSPHIGAPQLPRCEPLPQGGCVEKEPARIEWERVRKALLTQK